MKKVKQILLVAVAMILVSAISIAATFACLYDDSETVRNTFSIGKIELHLDEAKVNEDGKPVGENGNEVALADAPRVLENSYTLVPGKTYVKDPTVRVSEDSEACVLFLVLYIPPELQKVLYYSTGSDDTKYIEAQMRNHGWGFDPDYDDPAGEEGAVSYDVFMYNNGNPAYPGDVINIFDNIVVREDATYDQLQEAALNEMRITVYGFQNEGTEYTDAQVLWDIIVEAFDPFNQEK